MHVDFFKTFLFCHFQKRKKVRDVRMHPARRKQTVKMQVLSVVLRAVHRVIEFGIFEKFTVLDIFRDSRKFLVDDPARAHVEMADFAVSHLSVGKTDRKSARAQKRGRIFLHKRFDVGTAFHFNGVTLLFVADSVTVHNDDHIWFIHNSFSEIFFHALFYPISGGKASICTARGPTKKNFSPSF